MKEYYVEVLEKHFIYVEADNKEQAEEIAIKQIANQVPDDVDAYIIKEA